VNTLSPDPTENHLLAALPDAEWQRWLPQLERVEMPLGQVLYESGGTLSHVYFPTTAIVSLLSGRAWGSFPDQDPPFVVLKCETQSSHS
jgi:hypothetical protein